MAAKVKPGDLVVVTTGKDKGRRGEVKSCLADDRIIVSNVNMLKKHVKPNPDKGIKGGIVEIQGSIHVSNVALLDASQKRSRVGFRILENGKKVRYLKSNNEVIDK